MIFGQPLFLIALSAIAIPVIIHLYNFRRYRKIYFTNVRFISEITQETRKRNELKHLLILAARIFAIAAIVLAFAMPYIPSRLQVQKYTGNRNISIFVDNSFSMEAPGKNGILLDEAKKKAIAIANASSPSDLFQLLTNDLEGKYQRFFSRDDFIRMVGEIKISPDVRSLGDIMKRQSEFLQTSGGRSYTGYLLSDFQKTITQFPDKPDTSINWIFVPLVPGKTNNLYIDTLWFDSPSQQPGQSLKLNVRIRNASDEGFEKIPLKLTINGVQKAVSGFSIDAGSETTVVLPYTNNLSGFQSGNVEITDYPVTWDDSFFLSYRISPSIKILCINEDEENPFLNALYGGDSVFVFRNSNINQPEYSAFNRFQMIVLNGIKNYSTGLIQELNRFTEAGGTLLILPPEDTDPVSLNAFLSQTGIAPLEKTDTTRLKVSSINTSSLIFKDVFENKGRGIPENADLPIVMKHFTSSRMTRTGTSDLLKLQNGDLFLSVTSRQKGKIYLLYSPLNESFTNFPKNSIFVPSFYKIALLSQQMIPLYSVIGNDEGIPLPGDSGTVQEVYQIRKNDADPGIIPEVRRSEFNTVLLVHDQIREAGNYIVYSGKQAIVPASFNYDRKESDMSCYSPGELMEMAAKKGIQKSAVLKGEAEVLGKQIKELNQGKPLWKYFILAGLLFLLTEILLVRLIKE
ncbi:MAG: BatA domain-containing protein [Syntrophothermus sp.]